MGAYMWDDNPTLHVQKEFGLDSSAMQPTLQGLNITPEHHRLAEDPQQANGNILKNYLHYLVGVDLILAQ